MVAKEAMMGGYNWAADSLVQSVSDALGAQAAESRANIRLREAERAATAFEELQFMNASNLAEKQALRAALMRVDPNHPLLQNMLLREKVQEAGARAFAITKDWDAVRAAGDSFKY
jgi:hypothetical protein